ncbi:MAG: hypothetical protein LBV26_08570 [Bacteroidales bacterium]|jgi:hypothetical protein|nr:hypothetical protein [Bacteroidales bacterium]
MRCLSVTVFVVVLSLVAFPSCKNGLFGKKKAAAAAAAMYARQDSIRIADSLKKVQDALLAREQAMSDSIRLANEARLASKYHIIVGSFYTPEYAKNWAEEYRKQGYNVQILQMQGSRFELVSAESFSSFRPAFNRMLEYQESIMPDAWIYINE